MWEIVHKFFEMKKNSVFCFETVEIKADQIMSRKSYVISNVKINHFNDIKIHHRSF